MPAMCGATEEELITWLKKEVIAYIEEEKLPVPTHIPRRCRTFRVGFVDIHPRMVSCSCMGDLLPF
jgi:hypothetical protein